MNAIKENTVSAENQMKNSSYLSFLGNEGAGVRVLIVGNSITRHGPKADIGWNADHGMAASAPEKDYVHRLYEKLTGIGKDVCFRIRQCAEWEMNLREKDILNRYNEEISFNADVLVFRLGENVSSENVPYFYDALKKFVKHIVSDGCKIIFTTCFWRNNGIDSAIRAFACEIGAPCVELGDLGDDSAMKATGLFSHSGVAAHPGDKGMEEIAERIFNVLKGF